MTESRQPSKTGSPENKKVEAMNGKDRDKSYEVESAVVQGIAIFKAWHNNLYPHKSQSSHLLLTAYLLEY